MMLSFYQKHGYIIKQVLTNEECDCIDHYVEQNHLNAYYEKNSQEKFGYKFDKNELPIDIKNHSAIKQFALNILGEYDISVAKCYYKSALMARDIEYHQEYNYNAHQPTNHNWKDYIQVFIALEDHTLSNACLKIIPNSHDEGLLPYTDIVNSNLEHKRAVEYNSLKRMALKNGIFNCQLKKGEAVFFNHLIIHGSQSNNSLLTRKALVLTLYKEHLQMNEKQLIEFETKRKQFTIAELEQRINQLKNDINDINDIKF